MQQTLLPFATDVAGSTDSMLTVWEPTCWPVAPDWQPLVDDFFQSVSGQRLGDFMRQRLHQGARIFPNQPLRALSLTALARVRAVILGQDPYHGVGQAEGLAFSVPLGVRPPPSLRNIFQEVARDPALTHENRYTSGSLHAWASQGVLLLNTCLTVEEGLPASHAQAGWELLTDAVVQAVAHQATPRVFMLWGGHAQAKGALIENAGAGPQLVLRANHPSPLSARSGATPFVGCGHFGKANDFLRMHGLPEVLW